MRSLIVRLVLFLCQRFDIWPVEQARMDMGGDAKDRSQRWEHFAREKGGLFDMLDAIESEYLAAMGRTKPKDHDTLETLAIGAHVANRLRAEVRSVIANGHVQQANEDQVARHSVVPIRKSI